MIDPLYALLFFSVLMAIALSLFWPERGLFWRWRQTLLLSDRVQREDALKHIYNSLAEGISPTVNSIAGTLNINLNQAAEAIDSLQSNELIETSNGKLHLTNKGREIALRVIRAHRIYELYLADETGYKEIEWHNQAQLFEHLLTSDEVEALAARLGNPTHDPHGDPIPTADGYMGELHESLSLTALETGAAARIIHVEDEPEIIYAQLVAEGLHAGQEIRLLETTPERYRFWSEGEEHVLAPRLAANITVVPITEELTEESTPGIKLSDLPQGKSARVLKVSARIRGTERRRLMDLGVLPGTSITTDLVSAGGDPNAYRIRGALIALRKDQSDLIFVCPDAQECED